MIDAGRSGSFCLAAAASLTLAIESFAASFHSLRALGALCVVMLLHLVRYPRLVMVREAVIYACFIGYMLIQLLWTDDRELARNTLFPALNFLFVLVLFGSLAEFHDFRSVLWGSLAGFLAGAAAYTAISGFPLAYPEEFSYNAIAGMYLYGLLVILLLAALAPRKPLLLGLAAIFGMHVVATTSIKTNLGILVGAMAVAAIHFSYVWRQFWRHAIAIFAVLAVLSVAVATNEAAMETIRRGSDRIALGIQILQARENLPGYSAFEKRATWQRQGFRGWAENPVFGHGVEAFRARFDITSHASHVDILYNSGLIGAALFYGLFASVFWRLRSARDRETRVARLVILGGVCCYLFISFAGTIYYVSTLAAFLALGIRILKRA